MQNAGSPQKALVWDGPPSPRPVGSVSSAPARSPVPLQQRVHGAAQVEADVCDEGQDVAAGEGAGPLAAREPPC